MSRHHRAQRWSTIAPKLAAAIAPQLPLPCVNCGRSVVGQYGVDWHVGHRRDAAKGGQPTLANCGPAHARCNLQAGGRAGARIVNARRARGNGIREW